MSGYSLPAERKPWGSLLVAFDRVKVITIYRPLDLLKGVVKGRDLLNGHYAKRSRVNCTKVMGVVVDQKQCSVESSDNSVKSLQRNDGFPFLVNALHESTCSWHSKIIVPALPRRSPLSPII